MEQWVSSKCRTFCEITAQRCPRDIVAINTGKVLQFIMTDADNRLLIKRLRKAVINSLAKKGLCPFYKFSIQIHK